MLFLLRALVVPHMKQLLAKRKTLGILLVGIFAGLAMSTAVPDAQGAPPSHQDIFDAISGAVTTLTNVITGARDDIGTTSSVVIDQLEVDPTDSTAPQVVLIEASPGKTYSGHITFGADQLGTTGDLNTLTIRCSVGGLDSYTKYDTFAVLFEQDFSCQRLTLEFIDNQLNPQGFDAPPVTVNGVVQYVTSSDVTTIP